MNIPSGRMVYYYIIISIDAKGSSMLHKSNGKLLFLNINKSKGRKLTSSKITFCVIIDSNRIKQSIFSFSILHM